MNRLQLTRFSVPELDRLILRAGRQLLAVGRERYRCDRTHVTFERLLQLTRSSVPELDRFIPRAGRQLLAIGRERYRFDPTRVAFERL